MNKKLLFILSLLGGTVILANVVFAVFQSAPELESGVGFLSLNPETVSAAVNESIFISLQLEYAEDAYGVDIPITFNPAILQVADGDAGAAGVQISPGICPQPDHLLANTVDNTTGTINYVITSLVPSIGCSGGDVALIEFVCVGLGTTTVSIEPEVLISDSNLGALSLTKQNSTVTCIDATSTPGPTPTATTRPPTPTPTATPPVNYNYLPVIIKQLTK